MALGYDFFARNRARLLEKLGGGLVILSANDEMQQAGDMAYPFRQESNFWWLTGIEQPGWWVIIEGRHGQTTLVSPALSDAKMLFDGGLSVTEAKNISDADAVITADALPAKLAALSKKYKHVHILGPDPRQKHYEFVMNPGSARVKKAVTPHFSHIDDCRHDLAELRAIKSSEEIAAIRRAVDVTVEAFEFARIKLSRVQTEYELLAEFDYHMRSHNANHAYDPIVAGGAHACTLHYTANNDTLRAGELVVLDIGARVDGYAADVTRTWGVGEVDARRRAVHQAVVAVQTQIVDLIKPGLTVEAYIMGVDDIMREALRSLGLACEGIEMYRRYFPHAISHGLGVDVHDSLGGAHALTAGMVLTVEPGVYIPEEGIGVRIEDDILVTAHGAENLSAKLSTAY